MLKQVDKLMKQLTQQKARGTKYYNYYKGKHAILNSTSWKTRNNTTEVHNFCKQFIDNNTGFLLGNNVQITYGGKSADENTLVGMYNNSHLGNKQQQLNQKLLRDIQIFGYAFEFNYINKDGEFDMAVKTPLEVAVERVGNKVHYAIMELGANHYYFFSIVENLIFTFTVDENDKITFTDKKHNPISNPIIVVYNNWEKQSEMEDILTLQDAYNQVSSDATSEINDFRNAYMYFKGVRLNEEVLEEMNKSGIISTTNADSDVKFITKEINNDFITDKLKQLEKSIYDVSGQVNFNDMGVGSNTSSLALRNKLTNLMNKLKLKEGFLKESISLRMKNYAEFLETSRVRVDEELINPAQVDIRFVLNIPTNDKETADMVKELYEAGLISMESAISQLSFINKVDDEIEKIQAEQVAGGSISLDEVFVNAEED